MTQFVQITAQYSNAVLVAILPYVSDFPQAQGAGRDADFNE